jgi:tetratricopeptide (TPR) repeat protein
VDVEQLVEDLKKVRERGIRKTSLESLETVPALQEGLARWRPDIDDTARKHLLEDLVAQAANGLGDHDAEGIRLALGIGETPRNHDGSVRTSADRRAAFAAHYQRASETVRRPGDLEDQVFTKLAKVILSLPPITSPTAPYDDQPASLQPTGEASPATDPKPHSDGLDGGKRRAADHRSMVQIAAQPSVSTITSRSRAYHAIDSVEQDLRQFIERYLLDHLPPEDVFGIEYDQISASRSQDDVSETVALTQHLHPQQAYDVLLRHPEALPAELAEVLQLHLGAIDGFLAVRNRVMRGRPLQIDDLEQTESFITRFRSPHFRQTEMALAQLALDATWQPRPRVGSSPPERILHNLPSADFNETGLLGRQGQINEIVDRVKARRDRMFTLVGEGGIGKSALALEVCYRLADHPEPPFEAILWTSLKSEHLTPAGVQELSNAIRDIDGAALELGQVVDPTFQGTARGLAEALSEMTTLIVIDTLETVRGSEVVSLYDALPHTVSLLLTSRVGVGEGRRIEVGPLEQESADLLFRKFARARGLSQLADMAPLEVADVLRQLRYSPLAIRWYILSIEAGKSPTDTLRNQEELLRFCVQNVIDALDSDEKVLLHVLRVLDRPVSFEELAVISDMEIDTLRRGAQRLTQSSLLVWTQFTGSEESELLALSSTARAFQRTATAPELTEDVVRRESEYRHGRERERERIADHGRYLDPNVIFERSPSDAPTAHLLQQALRENKSGHPDAASATMARARALNPEYFEVDRVDAILASFRKETARATELYRAALSNCRTEQQRAWVGYFFARLLARQLGDISEAIRLTENAHRTFDSYDTALQLGNFYVWNHRFDEGRQLIESALERAPRNPRFKRIATTSLVECFQRWSEADLRAGLLPAALDRALRGLRVGIGLHDSDPAESDEQLMRSIMQALVAALKAVRLIAEPVPEAEEGLASVLQRLADDSRFSLLPSWPQLVNAVSSLTVEMQSRLAPGFVAKFAAVRC